MCPLKSRLALSPHNMSSFVVCENSVMSSPIEKSAKIRQYNITPVPIKPVMDGDYEHSLWTFSIDTENQYLKDIIGMVSKITFGNPDKKEIVVRVNGVEYTRTSDNHVSFTLPADGRNLTAGQHVQTNATNEFNKFTFETFRSFCDGNILKHYLNLSEIRNIELVGLSDTDPITLDMYTDMISVSGMQAPKFSSYSFSF